MEVATIQGERILLRRWGPDDIPALLRHANDPLVAQDMVDVFPHPYEQSDAEAWIELNAKEPFGSTTFAVEFEGEAVGGIGYTPRRDIFRLSTSIGYWIGRAHWSKGLATEALTFLTHHILESTELVRLTAIVFDRNAASARVLEKCGYQLESLQPRSVVKNGEILDTRVYVAFRPESTLWDIMSGAPATRRTTSPE